MSKMSKTYKLTLPNLSMQWAHQCLYIDALLLSMFAPSEDRPTPNNQKGAVTDQEQN